ncbi:replication initiator protein A [Deinococcus sp. QL22]|uniref:replication initiator protein A n=1 Tax=Deinococcus sp. QL22 TaxID=2939437 RepID=UPI002017245F|nr:replication initiator protein A [Deinococcus sp. QL22]UQN10239.1 replication initiator protein A [Deinococcus sp. QL22]
MTLVPRKSATVTRIQYERNLLQLGLVLAVQNVQPDRTSFKREIVSDSIFGMTTSISCQMNNGYTVPHGVDNDVIAAFITLFTEQGMPESGAVISTGYRLLSLVGLSDGGQNYKILAESLLRMQNAKYKITQGWFNPNQKKRGRGGEVTFHLLADVGKAGLLDGDSVILDGDTQIRIQLPYTLIDTIRSGYTRSFDIELYQSLGSILSRSLYRILEEVRNFEDMKQPVQAVKLPIYSWAEFLGYENMNVAGIKRNLSKAHDDLKARGFLKEVVYEGRGKACEIEYVFNPLRLPAPPADLVAMLTKRGFGLARARTLAAEFGRTRIEDAVTRFEYALARGTKVRGFPAMLTTILRAPEDYPLPDVARVVSGSEKATAKLPRAAQVSFEPPTDADGMVRSVLASLVVRKKISATEEALALALHAQERITLKDVTALVAHSNPADVIGRWVVQSSTTL